tara:strand:- start:2443 stop:4110 length:1668 start_codon:yes stop_codon:yes gene_type:complete
MNLALEKILTRAPFNLGADEATWVKHQLGSMSQQEKIGQLFILMSAGEDPTTVERVARFKPAGLKRFFGPDLAKEKALLEQIREDATIPMLFPYDMEGSRMSLSFGTEVPNPLAMAAMDDEDANARICEIMAREARMMGVNVSFTPVVDICADPRSAIVPTRGFGSDVERIARMARRQVEVLQANGIAATAKHWPGEGYDPRDQHLLTTINPLSMQDWHDTFGHLYSTMIEAGVMAIMSGHIALPAYVASQDESADLERYRPASISSHLNRTLLRDELGFNGVVVSDSSLMAGLGSWDRRDVTTPELIENGCDLILFSDDPEADFARIETALADGRLSQTRVDEAITRTLAMKAALGLHANAQPIDPTALASTQDRAAARAITARAPTLVKDVQNMLPLSVQKHQRLYVYSTGVVSPVGPKTQFALLDMLRTEGFEVTLHQGGFNPVPWAGHDAVLYLMGEESLLTRQNIFLNWAQLGGNFLQAMRRPWHDIPTALISFGHPFYLMDAPRLPCVVNAYATMDTMQEAVVDCLLGRTPFAGKSPVDPTGGIPDAIY